MVWSTSDAEGRYTYYKTHSFYQGNACSGGDGSPIQGDNDEVRHTWGHQKSSLSLDKDLRMDEQWYLLNQSFS